MSLFLNVQHRLNDSHPCSLQTLLTQSFAYHVSSTKGITAASDMTDGQDNGLNDSANLGQTWLLLLYR